MARLVSRSEFARIAGVSPAAITKACKSSLADGCVAKSIDLDSTCAREYLASKGVAPTPPRPPPKNGAKKQPAPRPRSKDAGKSGKAEKAPKPGSRRARPARRGPRRPPPDGGDGSPAAEGMREIEGLEHLTLELLIEEFGTLHAFRNWLDARKKLADLRGAELKNEETVGRLIERDFVRRHVFGAIEAGNRRLLGDTPKTVARRLYALARSDAPVEEAEKVVREILASQLQIVKVDAARSLRRG